MDIAPIQRSLESIAPTGSFRPAQPAEPVSRDGSAPLPAAPAGREHVKEAVQEIRQVVAPLAQSLQFTIDEATGKILVRVVDAATQEVIRQIPSEEVLAIARALDRLQGLLFKGKA